MSNSGTSNNNNINCRQCRTKSKTLANNAFAEALEYFDNRLPELYELMNDDDVLVICADHGCDPTWQGTDHTREHIPVLVYGASVAAGSLGKRETFADIGQSLAGFFGLAPLEYGVSFLD